MPRAQKGQRFGGRVAGVPNKATVERRFKEAQAAAELAKQPAKKLAKEVLEEFMHLTAGMAAFYQPTPAGLVLPQNTNEDEGKFWRAAEMTLAFATALAKYQSPTFKAIGVVVTNPNQQPEPKPGFPGNVIDLTDPETMQRVYRQRIGQVG